MKNGRSLLRFPILLLVSLALVFAPVATLSAASIDSSYSYDEFGNWHPAPPVYLPDCEVSGEDLSTTAFSGISDLFATNDGTLYVVDTGNHRILELDASFHLTREFSSLKGEDGTEIPLEEPLGFFLDAEGRFLIADKGAKKVYITRPDLTVVRTIAAPRSDILPKDFIFTPEKVLVDRTGLVYVKCAGKGQGLLTFDGDRFLGFYGSMPVSGDPLTQIWKRLSTRAQQAQMEKATPIEYASVYLSPDGFVYGAVRASLITDEEVRKLNPSGRNILGRTPYSVGNFGDQRTSQINSITIDSIFVDLCVDEQGVISVLDRERGRVFQYDQDRELLGIFGGKGEMFGSFLEASAIEVIGERILVADAIKNTLTCFSPTAYRSTLRYAIALYNDGKYRDAEQSWRTLLQQNQGLRLAALGIGKALLQNGDPVAALPYLERAKDFETYSEALELVRKALIRRNILLYLLIAGGLVGLLILLRKTRPLAILAGRMPRRANAFLLATAASFSVLRHPISTFEDVHTAPKRSLSPTVLLVFLNFATSIIRVFASGFLFRRMDPANFNLLLEASILLLPIALFTFSNWASSTLMDGEAKAREIWTVYAYSLIPNIVFTLPLVLLSNVMTLNEKDFLNLGYLVATMWGYLILFVGLKTVQQYTVRKTVLSVLLTLFGIFVILFLLVLFYSLYQQMALFVNTIYRELSFRFS
jgi:hypothetical protein